MCENYYRGEIERKWTKKEELRVNEKNKQEQQYKTKR